MTNKEIEQSEANRAFALFESLLGAKREVGSRFLLIGSILTEINEDKLYTYFNCETFQEFLAIPELGFAWQTARLFMHVFDLYIRRLKLDSERIAAVDISKLQVIAPVVSAAPDDWLSVAETMSRSDLINAVREEQGKKPMKLLPRSKEDGKHYDDFDSYISWVSNVPCCVCSSGGSVDAHHFPRSKGAGGADYKVIPLCRACHTTYHIDPHKFIIDNEEKIFDYFYDIIQQAYKIIKERQAQ